MKSASSPTTAATIPLRMYQVVACVNRPVNVLLTWSATECEEFIPTINKPTPTIKSTIPSMRCELMFNIEQIGCPSIKEHFGQPGGYERIGFVVRVSADGMPE